MGQACTICARDDVAAVNRARFEERLSFNVIAERYGLSKGTTMRHFEHASAVAVGTGAQTTAIAVVAPPPWPRPGPRCHVCASPHRQAIEDALLAGVSSSTLESHGYGISAEGIDRHIADCIPVALERAGVRITAGSVLERLDKLMRDVEEFLAAAKEEKDLRAWAAGLQRVERTLALLGRLTGEMRGSDEDALVRSPAWKRFKEAVERALLPYPEAAAALKAALIEASRSGR